MVNQIPCQTCGALFTPRASGGKPQVRCSERCRRKVANANFIKKNAPVRTTVCAECGGPVIQAELGRPRRFCSDECKQRAGNRALRRRRLPIRDPNPAPRNCVHCGESFIPKRRDQEYCNTPGAWCAQKASRLRRANTEPYRQVEQVKRCQECGDDFIAFKSNARWCSSQCRRRFTAREESRRRGPARPDASHYTDLSIFERDGWRCHICKKRVRRDVPRTHRDGATIDHLIPLSLGGADEPANVATAHNHCNREKNAGAANDQLAIF